MSILAAPVAAAPSGRLDSAHLKAYYRRGLANMALGKYKLAVKDFRKARNVFIEQAALCVARNRVLGMAWVAVLVLCYNGHALMM